MFISDDPLYKDVDTITATVIYADYNGRVPGYKVNEEVRIWEQSSTKDFYIPCKNEVCIGHESGYDLSEEIAHAVRYRLSSYDTRLFSCHYPVDEERCGISYQFRISISYCR